MSNKIWKTQTRCDVSQIWYNVLKDTETQIWYYVLKDTETIIAVTRSFKMKKN